MSSSSKYEAILTVPDQVVASDRLYLTGNEYLSLPCIDQGGAVESLNILHLLHRGLLEFSGSQNRPLLSTVLTINNQQVELKGKTTWDYDLDWLPYFKFHLENRCNLTGEIVAPPGFRGLYYRLSLENIGVERLTASLGWQVCWKSFNYILFTSRVLECKQNISFDRWTGSLVLEASAGLPLAALALATEPETAWQTGEEDGQYYSIQEIMLEPGESDQTLLYAAVNLDADGAGTSNVDLRRRGYTALKQRAHDWLENHRLVLDDSVLTALLNRNLFFSYFYSLGRSLDSDELVAVTSRSPRYYVSAAFWSRDTLLWSFPAIVMTDLNTARELLMAVFSRHIRNAGDHAHYINGTVLYPGFELDQLAAYFLALEHYFRHSRDYTLLDENIIKDGLTSLIDKAFDQFNPEAGLFSTFLDPSDDPAIFPFLTYNNALLQRVFSFLAELQAQERWHHGYDFDHLAGELQQAIYEHCTVKGPLGMMFAWAVDGKGKFSLYDNPPGSLQLLAHYGFCSDEDAVYRNTVRWIRSSNNIYYHQGSSFEETGSLHSGNPWPLGACNDLLACNASAVDFFRRAEMDNGFFCETVDPDTGRVSTGAAFASAAGFLAYALKNRKSADRCQENDVSRETESRQQDSV